MTCWLHFTSFSEFESSKWTFSKSAFLKRAIFVFSCHFRDAEVYFFERFFFTQILSWEPLFTEKNFDDVFVSFFSLRRRCGWRIDKKWAATFCPSGNWPEQENAVDYLLNGISRISEEKICVGLQPRFCVLPQISFSVFSPSAAVFFSKQRHLIQHQKGEKSILFLEILAFKKSSKFVFRSAFPRGKCCCLDDPSWRSLSSLQRFLPKSVGYFFRATAFRKLNFYFLRENESKHRSVDSIPLIQLFLQKHSNSDLYAWFRRRHWSSAGVCDWTIWEE